MDLNLGRDTDMRLLSRRSDVSETLLNGLQFSLKRILQDPERSNSIIGLAISQLDDFDHFQEVYPPKTCKRFSTDVLLNIQDILSDTVNAFSFQDGVFALLFLDKTRDEIEEEVSRLHNRLYRQQIRDDTYGEKYATLSTGIICGQVSDFKTFDDLISKAYTALRKIEVIDSGDGYAFYSKTIHDAAKRKLEEKQTLHRAFNNGEFGIDLQPIYEIAWGGIKKRVCAYEVLYNRRAPDGKVIKAVQYFELLESLPLARRVCTETVRKACNFLQRYNGMVGNANLKLHINLSPDQLKRTDLVDTLLMEAGVDKNLFPQLVFEITEQQQLIWNHPVVKNNLSQLRRLGVQLAQDDIGTGTSNHNLMDKVDFTIGKVAREIVRYDHQGWDILLSIKKSCKRQKMSQVIAEGPRDGLSVFFLWVLGYRYIQGDKVGPARSAEEILNSLSP